MGTGIDVESSHQRHVIHEQRAFVLFKEEYVMDRSPTVGKDDGWSFLAQPIYMW